MQNETDIQNFYGNQTYQNLMEYLKTLHSTQAEAFVLDELHLFGSSRLGALKTNLTLVEFDNSKNIIFEAQMNEEYAYRDLGSKRFELSNHLGNVLVTVSDKLVYVEDNGDVDYFEPEVTSISDYYPFGAAIATRGYSSGEYRYGYQGSEKTDEISGSGNHYTTFFRELDVRLGKWWTPDPKASLRPWESPYSSMGNNPIWRNDVLGDKWKTKADEKKAASLDKSLESRKNQLNKQADKFQARADKKLAKGKEDKANSLLAKANEARAGVAEMGQAQTELTEIGASETEFTFQQKTGNVSYTYMDAGGTVVIEFTTDANAIHELTHAYQHLSGQVELVAGTGGGYYVDVTDEQQAYRRQFFFSPFSVQGLNSDSPIRIKTSEDIKADWILKLWTYDKDGNKIYPYSGLSTTPANKPGSPADKK